MILDRFSNTLLLFLILMIIKSSSLIFPRKYGLHNIQLTFAVVHLPPFDVVITWNPDGNCSYSGSSRIIYEWLGERLNFRISYMIINDTISAKYGSRLKLLSALLIKKEVDGLTIPLIATPERKRNMDFAYFFWTEPYNMIVPRPGEEPRTFAFVWPFRPAVWLLILITMLVMVGFMCLFSKFYRINSSVFGWPVRRKLKAFEYAGYHLVYVFTILANQGCRNRNDRLAFRFLVGIWLLVMTVLINSYSGTVISYLTVPRMKPVINSFQDLASSHDVGVVFREDTVIGQQILEAKSGVLKIVGDMVRNNPNSIQKQISDVLNLLKTGHYAFPIVTSMSQTFVADQFKEEGKCRFVITDPLPMSGLWSVALKKDSKFSSTFNEALIELWETGLPPFLVKKYTPQAPQCFSKIKYETASSRRVSIRLNDLTGSFLVLFSGLSLASVFFVFEVVYYNWLRFVNGKFVKE